MLVNGCLLLARKIDKIYQTLQHFEIKALGLVMETLALRYSFFLFPPPMSLRSFGSLVNANSLKVKMAAHTQFVSWSVLTLVINSLSYLGYAPAPRHSCHQNVVYIFLSLGMEKIGILKRKEQA